MNMPGRMFLHKGTIVERISNAGSVKGDLDAICKEFDLSPPYTEEENKEAGRAPADGKSNVLICVIEPPRLSTLLTPKILTTQYPSLRQTTKLNLNSAYILPT